MGSGVRVLSPPPRPVHPAMSRLQSPVVSTTSFKLRPAEIAVGPMRFLITERPSDLTISAYAEELGRHKTIAVVRLCEPSYPTSVLENAGIHVLDWEFSDGSPPPKEIVDRWIVLAKESFHDHPGCCIAVHCIAGLGRAPVMVALALMEAGMKYETAVEMIREKRRGAINQKQLTYLEKYKPAGELKKLVKTGRKASKECCIM